IEGPFVAAEVRTSRGGPIGGPMTRRAELRLTRPDGTSACFDLQSLMRVEVRDDSPGRSLRLDGPPLEFEVPVGPDAREAFGEDPSKGGLRIALAMATERACAGYDVVVDRRVSSLHRERWPEAWRVA